MTASRRALAEEVASAVPTPAPEWREAVMAVPREAFLGAAVFRPVGGRWEPVHRVGVGEAEWTRMVHSDRTWVTQIDGLDAADAVGPVDGSPTSSATL
ncbi:methyltransferase, partial [Streptomyces daliensis]|nr:methyltransferase [Streptomyces daliensis]